LTVRSLGIVSGSAMESDLLLIHAPSVFDFRHRSILYGPISDVIPSTPVFEMYPVGFITLSNYLTSKGLNVRIINLAMKMLKSHSFDPYTYLARFKPRMFGLDLHWLPHVQGVVEVARLLKRLHPEIPIVLGGLSSSYFHREILENYPEIDYVIRGDCAEEPLAELVEAVKQGGDLSDIPNLSYRRGSCIIEGEISHVPDNLNKFPLDYRHMIRQATVHRDITSYFPFRKWFLYPITAVLTCKGCLYNCAGCGGSAYAYKRVANRHQIAFKDPAVIAAEVASITTYLRGPIFFLGDILQGGEDYFNRIMDTLRPMKIRNEVMVEFFAPPSRAVLEVLASTFPKFNIEISPESQDLSVRKAFGRPFDNTSLERFVQDADDVGCRRLDLFFMTGLPKQTSQSVLGTVDYCRDLLSCVRGKMRVVPFISPLAPFVDPGSLAFENPESFGYKLRFRSLEEHRKAMLAPNWKEMLNYETVTMDRDEIAQSTYEAAIGLSRLKAEYGLFKKRETAQVIKRAQAEMRMLKHTSEPYAAPPKEVKRTFAFSRRSMIGAGGDSVCKKEELNMPVSAFRIQLLNVLRLFITGKGS
jgi:B12-binding domain/radical SAM domain protein